MQGAFRVVMSAYYKQKANRLLDLRGLLSRLKLRIDKLESQSTTPNEKGSVSAAFFISKFQS